MDKNLKSISTVNMSYEEWLKKRRNAIGGSDAAAIVGCNSYSSSYTVWADKLGMLPAKKDNEAMRQGRDLEEYVAKRFTEMTGKKVRNDNRIIYNEKYPFAHANIDRRVVGEDAGLECKTTSVLNLKKFKNGEYPENYYVQSMHYMMVTGAKKWYIAVLILGNDFKIFEVERDEDEIAALALAEKKFWQLVQSKTPPIVDGSNATTEAIKTIYAQEKDDTPPIDLFAVRSSLIKIDELKFAKKSLDEEIKANENKVKLYLGKCTKGVTDRFKVSWSSSERNVFNSKMFMKDHPNINFKPYIKKTKQRVFRISNI